MVDASSKPSTAVWQNNILNFVSTVAGRFNINQNCVRVSVILYNSTLVSTRFGLGRYGDIFSLQQAIRSLSLLGGGGTSNFALALQLVRNAFFGSGTAVRPGARLLLTIVADQLQCNSLILSEANTAKNMQISILGVAITQTGQLDRSCMRQVVSGNQYIEVPAYNQLGNNVNQAVQYFCAAQPTPPPRKFAARIIWKN